MYTTQESIEQLLRALSDYIEATYHISAPSLIRQRKELLARPGIIHQVPYLESTPRYQTGERLAKMKGLPTAAVEAYLSVSKKAHSRPLLVYDPPYSHQSDAIRGCLIDRRNLVIMTGTGSGKTESFLLPILGKLACEGKSRPDSFNALSAMRALVLYPMNALVTDQLARLRGLFGDPRIAELFQSWSARPPRFDRYTSRTPYAGMRTAKKDTGRLKSFDEFYADTERKSRSDDSEERAKAQRLLSELKEHGKWPAKPDLGTWLGKKGSRWQNSSTGEFRRAVTLPGDSELLTRHEVQVAPPDLLVTNYSMLEYMLMRPIERPIFDRTREWLERNPAESFLVVLDEAHLYRGAGGAEVGLLIRRLPGSVGHCQRPTAGYLRDGELPGARIRTNIWRPALGQFGEYLCRDNRLTRPKDGGDARGTEADAEILSSVNLEQFYQATKTPDASMPFDSYSNIVVYRLAIVLSHRSTTHYQISVR